MTRTRLLPGVYSLIAIGSSSNDRWLNSNTALGSVVVGDSGDGAVLATNTASGGDGLSAFASTTLFPGVLVAGATFLFDVVPSVTVDLPQPRYTDCEAVACAGLASGEYNIRGQARYCDNDEAGGGWMRLWRVNDTSCEANGWTSMRNPAAVGGDPRGCRLTSPSNCKGSRINAPFVFNEVLGSHWIVWALGVPDAFQTPHPCDGVVVRDGNGDQVWVLAAGNPIHASRNTLCPCDSQFTSASQNKAMIMKAGTHWTCDQVPTLTGGKWIKLFDGTSSFLCSGQPNATARDLVRFQRVLDTPQVALSVAMCMDEPTTEDIKLASGDLYVRNTVGFDKSKHCPTTMAAMTISRVPISTAVDSSDVVGNVDDVGDAYWIVPTVIASVLVIVVCILVVVLVARKLRSNNANKQNNNQQQSNEVSNKAPRNQYSDRLSDIVPREPRSQYGALSTQERGD